MPDKFSKEIRSKVMKSIKSKDTNIERKLRQVLWQLGYRYRIHYKITGEPDIVFIKKKIAIFCDGCFWHGCPECYKRPKSNQEYWDAKIKRNRTRAKIVNQELENDGWTILRFWEHEIHNEFELVIDKIVDCLND